MSDYSLKIKAFKKEGEQEKLRNQIGTMTWRIRTVSEKINWECKKPEVFIAEIRNHLEMIEALFKELES